MGCVHWQLMAVVRAASASAPTAGYRRLWQMRRDRASDCCLMSFNLKFYSYAVPRTRAQCSSGSESRCTVTIPSQVCMNPLLEP